ncbi:hypothetical protein ACUN24_09170 [Pedobacter sp. WC2501]|uniref:hypothetical protein n=1 Tax=Pedobacter sp. WC2501 TaxID=3461400 RepID=UPI004045C940
MAEHLPGKLKGSGCFLFARNYPIDFLGMLSPDKNGYFCPVRNVWIYLMVFLYSFSNPGTMELLKAPYIAIHFLEHRALNHKISFADFISMHYLGKDIRDNDADKDLKLPFKKIIHGSHQTLFQHPVKANLPLAAISVHPVSGFPYDDELAFASSIKLFRPPKPEATLFS